MSLESFNKLVKLTARAFYDDITAKLGDNQPRSGRNDNRGIAVVVLDALTRRQWVREEDLAKDLKLHAKQLRRTLRFFEEEKLVTRYHRKETAMGGKAYNAAVAATAGREGEEKTKVHTHSYCCLDYAQIHDVVRYRLQRMRKKLKDEFDNRKTVQEYLCPKCAKRYNALDASRLISLVDYAFHCESCDTELVVVSDKLASHDIGDGDDKARRRALFQKLEVELKPLTDILHRVKDLEAPDYGTLQAWEVHASAAGSNLVPNANPMPYIGETKIEVTFTGEEEEEIKSESAPIKQLPPWMMKEGMNLTNEQRGVVMQESNTNGTYSYMDDQKDEKKPIVQEVDDEKKYQQEYLKAVYEALYQQQQTAQEATNIKEEPSIDNFPTDVYPSDSRKRQRDDDEENDVVWEEEAPAPVETFKADDEDDDGIDWEEG